MEEAKIEAEQEKNAKEEVNEGQELQPSQANSPQESQDKIENLGVEKGESEEPAKAEELFGRIEEVEKRLGEFEKKLNCIEENLGGLKTAVEELKAMVSSASNFASAMLENAFKEKFSSIAKEIEKQNEKIGMLMEEVGVGEGLNVAKIPPTILEIVYQSTLDDVVNAMFRMLGSAEAEKAILQTLEEVRERTSGSELFRFDGKRIRAREVAKSIEKKLVSAKQMQTTYDEILKRLLEHIPGYKPKNFRAMIKLKSQEYSVHAATSLAERLAEIEKWCTSLQASLSFAEKREGESRERINGLENSLKELSSRLDEKNALLLAKIEENGHRISELEKAFEKGLAELKEQIAGMVGRIERLEKELGIEEEKEKVCEQKEGLSGDESFLYYAFENEKDLEELKSTLSLMFSEEKIMAIVESLVNKGYLEKFEKEGRVYLRKRRVESLEEEILSKMGERFTFRQLQNKFKAVEKAKLQDALEKLIEEGKVYVEGTERRKIYRIPSQSMEKKEGGEEKC